MGLRIVSFGWSIVRFYILLSDNFKYGWYIQILVECVNGEPRCLNIDYYPEYFILGPQGAWRFEFFAQIHRLPKYQIGIIIILYISSSNGMLKFRIINYFMSLTIRSICLFLFAKFGRYTVDLEAKIFNWIWCWFVEPNIFNETLLYWN